MEKFPRICADNVVWKSDGQKAIVINVLSGKYYVLEGSALYIWESIAGGKPFGAILSGMTAAFDVDESTAKADLDEFIGFLCKSNLITSASD